jgi:hypothetical protein
MTARAARTGAGYRASRWNALRHGLLSRDTVLPWEDAAAYRELLLSLVEEHRPEGPTEVHLVEELAGAIWRKRRLRLAEAALARDGVIRTVERLREAEAAGAATYTLPAHQAVIDALDAPPEATEHEMAELGHERAAVARALEVLRRDGAGAYGRALAALDAETLNCWREETEGRREAGAAESPPYATDAAGLRRFLAVEVAARHARRREALEDRVPVRVQAMGEAHDPARLAALARYEAHLDRKLERTLAILVRLQQLKGGEQADRR